MSKSNPKDASSNTSDKPVKKALSMQAQKKFQHCYLTYRTDMYWYVRKKVNSNDLAEDLTADLFMKLLENEKILLDRNDNAIKAWLFTVARNMVIDYYRKNSRSADTQSIDVEDEVFEIITKQDEDYLADEIKDEEAGLLAASLEILNVEEKQIISLRFKEEFKFKEIADILGKDEGAVKMQMYRALEKLKAHLGDRI